MTTSAKPSRSSEERHTVDRRCIAVLDHGGRRDIAKEGNLLFEIAADGPFGGGPDDNRVGGDTMARSSRTECWVRLRFELVGSTDMGHEREMNIHDVLLTHIVTHLANRLEKW